MIINERTTSQRVWMVFRNSLKNIHLFLLLKAGCPGTCWFLTTAFTDWKASLTCFSSWGCRSDNSKETPETQKESNDFSAKVPDFNEDWSRRWWVWTCYSMGLGLTHMVHRSLNGLQTSGQLPWQSLRCWNFCLGELQLLSWMSTVKKIRVWNICKAAKSIAEKYMGFSWIARKLFVHPGLGRGCSAACLPSISAPTS